MKTNKNKLRNLKPLFQLLIFGLPYLTLAQFHTLKFPKASNEVIEAQRLGVTDIRIDYSSPSVNGRDVWNDENVIPQKGTPIAWRAGANMNTTMSFSTDVFIESQPLKAGTYGFHIIPDGNMFTLIFAHNYNQWGSYYLDLKEDVTLKVSVTGEECNFSEKLDYEFLDWSENEVTIGLEWANKRIPFKVSVDLNKTVIESFKSELRGINTYHWQAWNDAAKWCFDHNTNLEEALSWADRSIYGGYNGFAADKNITNLSTKTLILNKLNRQDQLTKTLKEAMMLVSNPSQCNQLSILMLRVKEPQMALDLCKVFSKKHPEAWFLKLNMGISHYFLGDTQLAIKELKAIEAEIPDYFKSRFNQIMEEVKLGKYQLPN